MMVAWILLCCIVSAAAGGDSLVGQLDEQTAALDVLTARVLDLTTQLDQKQSTAAESERIAQDLSVQLNQLEGQYSDSTSMNTFQKKCKVWWLPYLS